MIRIRIEAPTASSFVLNPTRKGDRQNHIRRSEQGKMRRKKEGTLKKEGTFEERGDVGSNATYKYFSKLPTSSELAYRLTSEVVTPKYRATDAPEYPILFTANLQNTFLALTTDRL
jgi:hypothetical protein